MPQLGAVSRGLALAALLLVVCGVGLGHSFIRTELREFYVAAVEVEWDYAPSGKNLIKNTEVTPGSYEAEYLLNGPQRIGRKYKKAVYKQYTDASYTVEVPKAKWQGLVGPILYAEVGDTIFVHFKNMASKPFTIHPHGVKYEKDSEGAVYEDGTSGKDKADEVIQPGGSHRFKWKVNEAAGPAETNVNCVPWVYHSHISTPADTNSGLMGALVICKDGILDDKGRRTDVDKDFVVLMTIVDENLSRYFDENVQQYITDPATLDTEAEDFVRSNQKNSINGYLYGNLPGLDICLGEKVMWNIVAFGTEADIHTFYFHGNTLTHRGHRTDSLSVTPAVMVEVGMEAKNPGIWLLTSSSIPHFKDGAQALYNVSDSCGTAPQIEAPVRQREYFVAAEEVVWNYAPFTRTHSDGMNFTDPESHSYPFFIEGNNRIGGTYMKAQFVGYTDDTFTVKTPQNPAEMGILGPVIRGEVGDVIKVTVRNMLTQRNISMQPHGVMYNKSNEGQQYNDGTFGADHFDEMIIPGSSYTYTWTIPDHVGPTRLDPDCITMIYTSAVDPEGDVFAGLVGPLLICKRGTLNSTTGKQMNVDREFFLLFTTFDENLSWFIDRNIADYTSGPIDKADEDFVTSNQMASINGYSYGNLAGMSAMVGERVSWHLMAVGKFTDEHAVSFNGIPFVHESRTRVSLAIFPGVSETVMMDFDAPGIFEIECETNSHFVNGMEGEFTVTAPQNASLPQPGEGTRTYYIGIVERYWDYVPMKWDPIRSQNLTDPESPGYVFVVQGDTSIGTRYKKALYREYTNETFTDEKPRGDADKHLGVQGPMLRMEVEETVVIVLKNMASRTYALEPHGVLVFEGETGNGEKGVAPGETKTYKWKVPDNAGPIGASPSCEVYAYYSNVDKERDTNSGLVGSMLVCRKDTLGVDGRRRDVDKEFSLLFTVSDENKSWYLDENIDEFCRRPELVDKADGDFEESNLMHGINGLLYSNLHSLDMDVEDTVEWYLLSIGDEVDVHSVHFHAQTVIYQTDMMHRIDVYELFAGVYGAVQMHADNPGHWLLHCHVNDHILGGMETAYNVIGEVSPTNQPATKPSTACCLVSTTLIVVVGIVMARKFN